MADEQKYKITVSGKEKEVTLDEMRELAQKGDDYTNKTKALAEKEKSLKATEEELAGIKSIFDEMKSNPKLSETLNKVYSDFKSGKMDSSPAKREENLKLLDKKIQDADPETRETLRDFRKILAEETEVDSLKNEVKNLREEMALMRSFNLVSRDSQIETEFSKLRNDFGEVVDKYAKEIKESALKYPNQSIQKLFKYFASDADLEEALLARAKRNRDDEIKRKENGSSTSVDSTTTKVEPLKDKFGRVDFKDFRKKLQEAGKFKLS